jgi:hypothetical protein
VLSVQRNHDMLQQMQDSYIERPNRPKPDGQAVETALGIKQQDGITFFGHKSEFTSTSGNKRTDEMWDSDFGIVVSLKSIWPQEGKELSRTVIDILRQEPDPKLFEIPAEYLPHPDALLDARTVFIVNQTGSADVMSGAEKAFTDWKRWAVVQSKESADLVATFTNADKQDEGGTVRGIQITINGPSSDSPAFQTTVSAKTSGTHPDHSLAENCVARLRAQVDNTRYGPITPPTRVDDGSLRLQRPASPTADH